MLSETRNIDIAEYTDVARKVAELGCRYPERLALLPINFDSAPAVDKLLQASEAATIRKLLVAEGLPLDEIVDASQRLPYVKNKSHAWMAPILFVSAALFSQNPDLVSLALNVIGNYATEFFRGERGEHEVRLDVVVEKKRNETYKKISYRGPVAGLNQIVKAIREAVDE